MSKKETKDMIDILIEKQFQERVHRLLLEIGKTSFDLFTIPCYLKYYEYY